MMTLYMVTHKDVDFIPKGRTPIFVGGGDNPKGFIRDNTGDNIAGKNKNYCELTALYWIWKNDKSDYVGIEHYRRLFMSSRCPFPIVAKPEQLQSQLKKYDVITSKNFKFCDTIEGYYDKRHHIVDLQLAREAIQKYCPEYIKSFDGVMKSNRSVLYNMLVINKGDFDKYCAWLFPILFYVEEHTDLTDRTEYQQRAYGFLSERLMMVWLVHNGLKMKQHAVYRVSSSKLRGFLSSAKHRWKRMIKIKSPRR